MPQHDNLDNIFSSLVPIGNNRKGDGVTRTAKSIFKLEFRDDEPFIAVIKDRIETRQLSTAELRVYKEIQRLATDDDIFGLSAAMGRSSDVSLWEHPYLLNLIESEVKLLAPDDTTLEFSDSPAVLILSIKAGKDDSEADISLRLRVEGEEKTGFSFLDDTRIYLEGKVYKVKSVGPNFSRIKSLIAPVQQDLLEPYITLFLTYVENILPELNGTPARESKHSEKAFPTIFLEKVAPDKALYLRVGISVESLSGNLPDGLRPTVIATIADHDRIIIRAVDAPDLEESTSALESLILSSAPNRQAKNEVFRNNDFFIIPEETAGPFLLKHLPRLLEEFKLVGSDKLREYKVVAAYPKLNLNLSSGIDFLEGEGDVTIGDQHFTIADILNQFSKKRYIKLSDGNRGIIDESYINRLQRLFRRRDKEGRIKVTIFDLPEVEEMINSKIKGTFANRSRAVLEGFNELKNQATPQYKVDAKLRPYQNEGVKWLKYLYDNNLGGCLADDMGLGKTLQSIALLSLIYPECKKPSLIVMPRSLLFNWEKELKKFASQISFSTYYGTGRDLDRSLESNLVLTTYAIVRNDIEKLKGIDFECILLDESQNIKTFSSQITTAVQLLNSTHRIALSGTPMENNLTELYSLFRFLNPPMFGTLEDFNNSYTYPIQKNGDKDASDSLRRKIFPFILRRLKKDVLDDLPPRIDQTMYVEMSESQQKLYNERRLSYRQQIEEAVKRDGVNKSQFLLFQALNELRRIASVPESVSDNRVRSPKIEELVDSLMTSVENGHKAVVFFNFIAGLEIVAARLEKAGIGFESMTGSTSTSSRKKIVETFQTDPDCRVMLMTLKVGGVGLNLTAADTVYMFEPWWNKAAEEQAINRLHRIGQKSTVSAFSIITVGTIEEKILQLQEQKSELFNELISADGASSKSLTEKDIDFILS